MDQTGLAPTVPSREVYSFMMELLIVKTDYIRLDNRFAADRNAGIYVDDEVARKILDDKRDSAQKLKNNIKESAFVKENVDLKKLVDEILDKDGRYSTPEETSALLCVFDYYIRIKNENLLKGKPETEGLSYQELKNVYDSKNNPNILYYINDIYDINDTKFKILKDNYFLIKSSFQNTGTYEYNGKTMLRVDIPDSQEDYRDPYS